MMVAEAWLVFFSLVVLRVASPANVTSKCFKDSMDYLSDLNADKPEIYAVLMYDAVGKLGSGIVKGNVDRLGSYSECLSVQGPRGNFQGEYCKLHVKQNGIKFAIGVCVPDSCTSQDVTALASTGLLRHRNTSFLAPLPTFIIPNGTGVTVADTVCSRGVFPLEAYAIVCLCLSGLLIVLIIAGSIYSAVLHFQGSSALEQCQKILPHRKQKVPDQDELPITSSSPSEEDCSKKKSQTCVGNVLRSFALQENILAVMSDSSHTQAYPCLNGIRVLSLLWIISGHTYQLASRFLDNPLEWKSRVPVQPLYVYALSGPVYLSVDAFFFLSGFLGAKTFLKMTENSENKVTLGMALKYIYRRLKRLQPLHLGSILLSIALYSLVRWGVFWEFPKEQWNNCKHVWWANVLLITNIVFVPTGINCFPWSWYLSVDFQFHLTVPLLIFLYVKAKRVMIAAVTMMFIASALAPTLLSYFLKLPLSYMAEISQYVVDHFVEYYTKPYCRYGPFLVGIVIAVMLPKNSYIKNKAQAAAAWLCALLIMFLVICLPFVLDDTPTSYSISAAIYQGVHRTLWSAGIAMIVVLCHKGYGGLINTMLSWAVWNFLSKISYACYLIHPIIIILYCGLQETLFHYQDINMFYHFIGHCVLTFIAGLALTVMVERPFQRLLS